MKKIIIAIDGYSSTGKSTIAKQLADSLGYLYVDTGAMYRAIAFYALEASIISEVKFDKKALIDALPKIALEFKKHGESKADMFLNGVNIEKEIRQMRVSNFVSPVAAISEVRAKLVALQNQMGALGNGLVMDGRDIGTVVFPLAELKIFLTASAQTRAERRYKELLIKDPTVQLEEVIRNIEQRDHLDTTRADSPLTKASDAIEIDNSNMTLEEQFDIVLQLAKDKIAMQI